MENGHPVTAAELRAALTATKDELAEGIRQTRADVQIALTRQKNELVETMRHALTTQKDELVETMRQDRAEFRNALTTQKDELVGTMRQIETNLLTEFHRYATGQQRRFHTLEVSSADIIERLATIEQRLLALEARRPPSI
jgi:hypothetical protein